MKMTGAMGAEIGSMQRQNRTQQWIVRLVCALALLFVGFAHQPVAVSGLSPAEVALYTLPDGTLPDLCIGGDADGHHQQKHAAKQDCEACRISAAVLLPQPADTVGIALSRGTVAVLLPSADLVHRQVLSLATAPRAPPETPVA